MQALACVLCEHEAHEPGECKALVVLSASGVESRCACGGGA